MPRDRIRQQSFSGPRVGEEPTRSPYSTFDDLHASVRNAAFFTPSSSPSLLPGVKVTATLARSLRTAEDAITGYLLVPMRRRNSIPQPALLALLEAENMEIANKLYVAGGDNLGQARLQADYLCREAATAMEAAARRVSISPDQIDYIVAAGRAAAWDIGFATYARSLKRTGPTIAWPLQTDVTWNLWVNGFVPFDMRSGGMYYAFARSGSARANGNGQHVPEEAVGNGVKDSSTIAESTKD
jgi:hypothetical protein